MHKNLANVPGRLRATKTNSYQTIDQIVCSFRTDRVHANPRNEW